MDDSLKQILAEQFAKLPKAVQRAITSADVEKEMRALAEKHKLHLDQWQLLENEVFMAILGIKPAQEIVTNIKNEVGVSEEIAAAIVGDITKIIFEPIREELERELGAPQAKEEGVDDIEKLRQNTLAQEGSEMRQEAALGTRHQAPADAPQAPVMPATPPPPQPSEKIARAPASGAYLPGQTSAARANVVDDPYRESPQ